MFPESTLSSNPMAGKFLLPRRANLIIDTEFGKTTLNETHGNRNQIWECFYEDDQIKVKKDNEVIVLHTISDVIALSLSFDLNMRPAFTFTTIAGTFLSWYNPAVAAQVLTSLDDFRDSQTNNADIILSYIKDDKAYMRLQRERYEIEHLVSKAKRLVQAGMMENLRFGFAYYNWDESK